MGCMGLRLNVDALLQPHGPVPRSFKPVLDSLHLENKVKADVSLWQCMVALTHWANEGETTCTVASILLAVFVVLCTMLDVATLLIALLEVLGKAYTSQILKMAWVLKHVSMLDVFCMGIIVVCLAGAAYRKMGIELELMPGIILLIGAEIVHSLLYYTATHSDE